LITMKDNLLRGSYPPVFTPFRGDSVDYDAFAGLIEFQVTSGSHGLVINGTTAEPSLLTIAERKKLLEVAIDANAGRVPLIAATGSQSYAETLELSEHANRPGVDALLIVTPYYIRPPQRGLVAYYKALGERTELPMLMYHIPGRAAVNATIDTLKEIVDAVPHFVGMKHAALDLALVSEAILAFGPEFRVFVGLEELSFPMLAMGACGMVNAVSNIAPRKVADLYNAVAAGDLAGARKLHYDLWELNQAVFFDINPIPMKYMAKRLGILPANDHRLPLLPATPEVERKLDAVMEKAGLLAR
jgi:4-hydroxy-tetrahydrodipicolinate synthase